MKKIVVVVLCVGLILINAACGTKGLDRISEHAYEVGCGALETLEEFIDGEITGEAAIEKLERAQLLASSGDGENDVLISSAIFNAEYAVQKKENGTGTMSSVKEHAEGLAEMLGK